MGLDSSFYAIKEIILDLLKLYLDLRQAVLKILAMCKYKIYVREYFYCSVYLSYCKKLLQRNN